MPEPFRIGSIGRHGLVYAAGILLNRAVAFVMLPVYTRYLSPADYGVLQLVMMTLDVVSILAGSRLVGGIFHFYHKTDSEEERKAVLSTSIVLLALLYAVAATLTYIWAPQITTLVFGSPDNVTLVRIAAASFAFEAVIVVPLAFIQVMHRSTTFVIVNAVKLVLQLSFNILFVVVFLMGAKGVLVSTLIANTAIGTFLAVYLLREVGLRLSSGIVRDLVRFGLPLVVTQAATFFTTFGDRYFLQATANSSAVGLYSLAYQFAFLFVLIGFTPFQTVWAPARFEVARSPDRDDIYARVFVYANVILLTVAVGIALFVDGVIRIMAAPAFHTAAAVVPILLAANVFQAWTDILNVGILIRERTKYITLANYAAVAVALGGYIVLIPRLQGLGAAVATLTAYIVRFVLVYWWSQRLWPIRYRWGPVVRIAVLATVVSAIGVVGRTATILGSLSIGVALLAAFAAIGWHLNILTDRDKTAIVQILRSPRASVQALIR